MAAISRVLSQGVSHWLTKWRPTALYIAEKLQNWLTKVLLGVRLNGESCQITNNCGIF
jgi:hypothetical protein